MILYFTLPLNIEQILNFLLRCICNTMIKRTKTPEEWKNIIGKLSPENFEHLCYQLVKAMPGFINVDLREGSYDSGRDIDAIYRGKAPDGITEITEKWRFECKKYSKRIPFDDISGKIRQADLNKIDKLVIMSNMHLTPACKDKITKIQDALNRKVLDWTGVHFQDILFLYPTIYKGFFPDEELPQRFLDTKRPQKLVSVTQRASSHFGIEKFIRIKKHAGQMLKKKYFLIYLDILGFEERAEKEAEKSGIRPEEVRSIYRERIKRKLNPLKENEIVLDFQEMSLDSWLLFSDTIWKTFRSVGEVLKTNLPFEIAIGAKDFDESPAGEELIALRNETMDYLKTNILKPYKTWYCKEYEKSVEQTFILLTPEAYKELESKKGKRIGRKPYESADFYLLEQKEFERKLEVLEFLEKIDSQRDEYREIEDLYVEPENYNEIVEILKKHNIVFIIGDAEIGKTYTAIKLLFEFFKQGYEPQYIPEEYRKDQWWFIRHEGELEGKAVYLEDPWGKVKFQTAESIFREIGDFIINVKKKKCKIIVTSREKVFKEFETGKTTVEDLWRYVSNLKVNLAYTDEELREMVKKYIDVFEPEWSENKELRGNVFRAVGEKLKTPMSINRMIYFTKDALDEDSLMDGIERASKETKIEFAKEIREMFNKEQYDKIVFLSFPYIGVGIETAKSAYDNCLKDLGYSLRAKEFETLLEDFKEVESLFGRLRFVHPSYWEAFSYALIDEDRLSNICKKIFFKVSISLAKEDEIAPLVIWMVSPDFDKLLRDDRPSLYAVTHALLRYANELEYNGGVARIGADWVSDNRNWILDIIAKYVRIVRIAPRFFTKMVLAKIITFIAEKLRNDVAQKYEDTGKAVRDMVEKLKSKNLSTEDVKKWIFEVAELYETIGKVIRNIAAKLWLSNEVVFKVAEKYEVAGEYAWTVAENFDFYVIDNPPSRIDKDFKDLSNFLLILAEREEVARAATSNFDKLPIEIKIKLIELISRTIASDGDMKIKPYKSFALEILDKLSKDETEEVKTKAKELIKSSSHNFKSGK